MERRLSITTWLCLALLILLGSYVYFVEVRGGERRQQKQEAAAKLLPFSREAASELVLERPGERIVCRKKGGRWRVTAPIHAAADLGTVDRILEDIAEARLDRQAVERPADLSAFGLARPTVLTAAAGPRRQVIEVGKENPTGQFVFARRGRAGPILLVDRRLKNAAQTSLYDLRDKTVLDFSPEDVTRVTFTHGGRRVRLVREGAREREGSLPRFGAEGDSGGVEGARESAEGTRERGNGGTTPGSVVPSFSPSLPPSASSLAPSEWILVEPLRARADRGAIERMFNLISYLRAEEFISEKPENLKPLGLDPPLATARFDLKAGRSEMLLIGRRYDFGATTRNYARKPGSGPVFTINDNLPQDAQQPAETWRDRHVTDFVRADATELRLISPARAIICAKVEGQSGDEWRLAEYSGRVAEGMNLGAAARLPTAQKAERDRVEDLLAKLSILEARSFLQGASPAEPRFGLAPPELKVIALDREGKALASLSLGKRTGAGVARYATGPHLGGVFVVPSSETERFRVSGRDLAARH